MEQIFKVEGMSCGHCVTAVKKELNKNNISYNSVEVGKVVVDVELNETTADVIIKAIEEAGYKVVNN